MPLEAVIFDLDDTLIDWWGSIERCLAEFAGDDVIAALQDHCRRELWHTRPGSDDVWHRNTWALHAQRDEVWPVALAHVHPDERVLLSKRFDEELWVGFFPEVVPTLDVLLDEVRLAVLSNNRHLPAEAERLRLTDWFELTLAAPEHAQKPHPQPFHDVCSRLGLPASSCAYVGDSVRADVLGAKAAGMIPVWLNRWHDAWPERPAAVVEIHSLAELPAIVAERRSVR